MNYTDLIQRLRETSRALDELAEHLSELADCHPEDREADVDSNCRTNREADRCADCDKTECDKKDDKTDCDKADCSEANSQPRQTGSTTQQNQQPKPPLANMLGNLMRGVNTAGQGMPNLPGLPGMPGMPGMPGLPGLNMANIPANIPKSMEELQANPQLMSMLDNVRNNPQMLNMISSISGLDSSRIAQALQSIHQPAEAATPAQSAAAAADIMLAAAPTVPGIPQPQMAQLPQTAPVRHLDSLLNEWRWQPYARVWSS